MTDENNIKQEQIPIIRITLDSLKQTIMHMFNPEMIKQAIESRLDAAIAAFDFDGEVRRCAENCLQESVKEYFSYGEGHKLIFNAVKGAISESMEKFQELEKKIDSETQESDNHEEKETA